VLRGERRPPSGRPGARWRLGAPQPHEHFGGAYAGLIEYRAKSWPDLLSTTS
jgi:hypothetical protein